MADRVLCEFEFAVETREGRGIRRPVDISFFEPKPGRFSTWNPAPSSAARTGAATLQVASVAPGAASRPRCRSVRGSHMAGFFAGAKPSRNIASAARRSCGRPSATSPKKRVRTTLPPSSSMRCMPGTSIGQRLASSFDSLSIWGYFFSSKTRSGSSKGCFSIETKCSLSQRCGSSRQACQVARNDSPKPKPVSRIVKLRRPRQRCGSPLPSRNT